jgi:transcriptional accessory protein Tex/SPT6
MRKISALVFLSFLCACRTAPTRQELIDNALTAQAAKDALDESQKELSDAADDLEDAADFVPVGPHTPKLTAAVNRTVSALEKAEKAAAIAKDALDKSQKLLSDEMTAHAQTRKERDENARDAGRWRIAQWVLLGGFALLVFFIIRRRLA